MTSWWRHVATPLSSVIICWKKQHTFPTKRNSYILFQMDSFTREHGIDLLQTFWLFFFNWPKGRWVKLSQVLMFSAYWSISTKMCVVKRILLLVKSPKTATYKVSWWFSNKSCRLVLSVNFYLHLSLNDCFSQLYYF